jgi:DHA1 family bicyclomycin/chloramphenicol resistance-like MFS transporter
LNDHSIVGGEMSDNKYLIIAIVVSLAILSLLATDFYVPAMPDMVNVLLTTPYMVKLTVTLFMLGLAFSPLVFGPLSDRYGRRPVLLLCAGLGLLGTMLCWAALGIEILILARLLQGIGLGGALSLARTIGSDLFEKHEFAQVAGVLSLCSSIGPAVAPVIGSYIHAQFGWRSIFMLLTALVSISFVAIIKKVPETIAKRNPQALHLRDMINNYRELLMNRIFIYNTILAGLTISTLILFGVLSTFILQNEYHLTPMQYGWIMMLVTAASVFSRTANIIMLRTKSPEQCINIGLVIMLCGAIIAVLMSLLQLHFFLSIIIPAMIIIFGAGLIPSNTSAIALTAFRHKGGSAGAIYGCITMFSVFVVSLIGSFLPASALVLALLYLSISLLSLTMVKLAATAEASGLAV